MSNVVTRIAPSPTGEMHIGTVRTALFNYLFAKHHGGTYFVRIEDTDRERNRPEWVDAIWRDFEWCGLSPDARYVQSAHLERHRTLLKQLIDAEKAFVSREPAKEDPSRIVEVVRLRNTGTSVTFDDLIRGSVTFDTTELGDFVIARSIDDPLYHFAVVADDEEAGVTHVIRAEEHISNTPRQILIQEALGFPRPLYAHIPLILAPDRSKLSKRKHGASIDKYRAQGFLPGAIINYLALLGWNPGTEQEIFTLEELVRMFDLSKVHRAGAIFDIEKLRWFNKEYMLHMPQDTYVREALERIKPLVESRQLAWNDGIAHHIVPLVRERISVWGELETMAAEGEFDFYFSDPVLDAAKIPDRRSDAPTARAHLQHIADTLKSAAPFTDAALKALLWDYATEHGRGAVLWPMRYALSGRDKSPDPFIIASIIGPEAARRRILAAASQLQR